MSQISGHEYHKAELNDPYVNMSFNSMKYNILNDKMEM